MCVIICISWNLIQGVGCSPELPAFAVMTNMARQAEIISGQHVYISCLMSSAGYTHTSSKLCHNELSTGGWRSTWWGHPQWKKTRQEFWRQVLPTGEHLQSPLLYCMHTVHTPHTLSYLLSEALKIRQHVCLLWAGLMYWDETTWEVYLSESYILKVTNSPIIYSFLIRDRKPKIFKATDLYAYHVFMNHSEK